MPKNRQRNHRSLRNLPRDQREKNARRRLSAYADRYGIARTDAALGAENVPWVELAGLTASDKDKTGPNERDTDGYTRGDVRMGADLGDTWSFVAAVENFTDELYQDHLSSTWQEFGLNDQAGRNVKLMAKARF